MTTAKVKLRGQFETRKREIDLERLTVVERLRVVDVVGEIDFEVAHVQEHVIRVDAELRVQTLRHLVETFTIA